MFFRYSLTLLLFIFFGCERLTDFDDKDLQIPPGVPQGLRVYAAYDGAIDLVWLQNVEPGFARYRVYRSINDSLSFYLIDSTSRTYYYDDSLEYDKKYYYYITAINTAGVSSNPSNIVSAVPINLYPPIVPRFLQVYGRNWYDEKYFTLNWQKNFESDVAGYLIFRSDKENFETDSTTLIGFSVDNNYIDNDSSLIIMQEYFYRIKSVDNGGLASNPGNISSDLIHNVTEIIYPSDNSETGYFQNFIIKTLDKPARYKIILQTNQYFGEIWSKEVNSALINDTLLIPFDASFIFPNRTYYWRLITYSKPGIEPNSISPLYNFYLKQ